MLRLTPSLTGFRVNDEEQERRLRRGSPQVEKSLVWYRQGLNCPEAGRCVRSDRRAGNVDETKRCDRELPGIDQLGVIHLERVLVGTGDLQLYDGGGVIQA